VPVIVEGLQMVRPGLPVKTEVVALPRPAREGSEAAAGRPVGAPVRGTESAGREGERPAPDAGAAPRT